MKLEVVVTRLILIIILLLFPRGSALAVDWKQVSHEEAKIVASLDWFWVRPENGGYSGAWNDKYSKFMQYAWWTDGRYPRLELFLDRLAPGRYWKRVGKIDKDVLTMWNHLRNASLGDLETVECNAQHCVRFTAEQVNCFAFRYLTGPYGNIDSGDDGTDIVTGYYCADWNDDAPIPLVDKIISSIELRE